MSTRKAFTLIELLVVIAIIAILAAILFPVFAQAKLAAKKSADLSNSKQLSLAQVIYCGDNDDLYPGTPYTDYNNTAFFGIAKTLGFNDKSVVSPTTGEVMTNWIGATVPYLKSIEILASPGGVRGPNDQTTWENTPGQGKSSFVMNGLLQFESQNSVDQISNTVMLRNHRIFLRVAFTSPSFYGGNWVISTWNGDPNDYLDRTFSDGENVGWADGHASYKKADTLTYHQYGFTNITTDPTRKPLRGTYVYPGPRSSFPARI